MTGKMSQPPLEATSVPHGGRSGERVQRLVCIACMGTDLAVSSSREVVLREMGSSVENAWPNRDVLFLWIGKAKRHVSQAPAYNV